MTPNEIQVLVVGLALGAQTMQIAQTVTAHRAERRATARVQALAKRAAGDRYLDSLELYQIQHRSRV